MLYFYLTALHFKFDSFNWTVGSTIRQSSIWPRPQRTGPAHKLAAGLLCAVFTVSQKHERRYTQRPPGARKQTACPLAPFSSDTF